MNDATNINESTKDATNINDSTNKNDPIPMNTDPIPPNNV